MENLDRETIRKQAKIIADGITEDFIDEFLVKPLDPIKVTKEFSKPIPTTGKATEDENGIEAVDYDKVETEVKEVESDYRKGIVIKIPISYTKTVNTPEFKQAEIEIGDTVIFKDKFSVYYDLFKDSKLVRYYNIVAIDKC